MTRRKALLFYQMIQRYKFHKVPGRKKEKRKNETVAVTISFYLYRDLFFSVATELLFVGFWRCVGEMNICPHQKDYQQDTRLQNIVHRSGTFTIASNYILLALCSFTT